MVSVILFFPSSEANVNTYPNQVIVPEFVMSATPFPQILLLSRSAQEI